MPRVIPVVDYLVLGEDPHLEAHECAGCAALYFDRRNACAKCSNTSFVKRRLSNEGVVSGYTIVRRGVKSWPFTSVVVRLDGGGVVKANLLDTHDPADVETQRRVRLTTFDIGTDDDGNVAVAFGFERIGAHK